MDFSSLSMSSFLPASSISTFMPCGRQHVRRHPAGRARSDDDGVVGPLRSTSGWAAVCSSRIRFIAVLDVFVHDTTSVEVGEFLGRRSGGFYRRARGQEVPVYDGTPRCDSSS